MMNVGSRKASTRSQIIQSRLHDLDVAGTSQDVIWSADRHCDTKRRLLVGFVCLLVIAI